MPKKRSRAVAEIHLSPSLDDTIETEHNNSSWLSNEDINGYAVFKLPPGVEFSHSKIALKGQSRSVLILSTNVTSANVTQALSPRGPTITRQVLCNGDGGRKNFM